jgi:uncharacterized membrane protein YfcA
MELQNTALIALIGAAAGILGGMFGLGGAIIIIPALVMILGYRVAEVDRHMAILRIKALNVSMAAHG